MFFVVAFLVLLILFLAPPVLLSYFFKKRLFVQTLTSTGVFFSGILLLPVLTNNNLDQLYIFTRSFLFIYIIIYIMLLGFGVGFLVLQKTTPLTKKHAGIGVLFLTFVYLAFAIAGGQEIHIKKVLLPAKNITTTYTFVHISDLHSGSTSQKHTNHIVKKIKKLKPEFVVITGDFIDTHTVQSKDFSAFKTLLMPVYLISGNHDHDVSINLMREIAQENNVVVIDDTRVSYKEIDIIGAGETSSIASALHTVGGIKKDTYTVLLKHEPSNTHVHYAANNTDTDLMLAGHTHGGQIWPFNLIMSTRYTYLSGLYTIAEMFLYVNQGTGTLGPLLRFGTQNEITLITLAPLNK